ncbi:hypothetical protein HYT92_01935 [Candidatus Pacearchaeota archaeon]|nr:hypothetical protein [Candidatus Pacearchaeota archaeon]
MIQSKLEQLLEKAQSRRVKVDSCHITSATEPSLQQRPSFHVWFNYTPNGLNYLQIRIEFGEDKEPFEAEEIKRLASDFGGNEKVRIRYDDDKHNIFDMTLSQGMHEAEIYAVSKIETVRRLAQRALGTFKTHYRFNKAIAQYSGARVDEVIFSKSQPFLYISPERIMRAFITRERFGKVVENSSQNSRFLYSCFEHEGYNNVSLEISMDKHFHGVISAQDIRRFSQAITRNGYAIKGDYFARSLQSTSQEAKRITI